MKAESIIPNPKSTINSYRSFGYNLQTAVADIIDNSISAKATEIYLDFEWRGNKSYISILDNGVGMNVEELVNAMTPGSKDPEEDRDINDLGRFGMGLKSASFSQCKSLTVISKKRNYHVIHRQWDIDFINEINEWTLLNVVSDVNFVDRVDRSESGTMVVWEKLDRIIGIVDESNEMVKNMFYEKMMEVKKHIALVFHKFIEKGIRIYYKGEKIEPFNPFLYFLGNVVELESEELDGGNVKVKSILLPHMSKIGSNYERTGGAEGWLNDQGFYVYRGDRLLVWATWLGLGIKKKDHFKLVRIAINITNEKDFDWSLDIKKSKAQPPIYLRDKLKKIANYAIKESAKVYLHRAGGAVVLNPEKQQPLWREYKDNEDVVKYKINRDHPIIKLLKDNTVDETILVKALNLIEDNVPISLIVKNQNDNPILHEKNVDSPQPDERIIALARYVYEEKIKQGENPEDARVEIMNSEPFNRYPKFNLL